MAAELTRTRLGLILPLSGPTTGQADDQLLTLVEDGIIESVWVRDLPAVAADDADIGQGSDPWWALGRAAATLPPTTVLGTASMILGVRHPLVVARAAVGAQLDTQPGTAPLMAPPTHGRFVLGVGTGGKPELNRALGLTPTDYVTFAAQWHQLRSLLNEPDPTDVSLHLPSGYTAPPMYLATSDIERWRAIDGQADGWQTFLTDDPDHFFHTHGQICTLRGSETPVDLRLDVELVPTHRTPTEPVFTVPSRGRVRCSAAQLAAVIAPWTQAPVQRLLLRAHGYRPDEAVHEIHRLLTSA